MLEIIGYITGLYLGLGVVAMATALWYTQGDVREISQKRGISIAVANLRIFGVGIFYWPLVLYAIRKL
jgi:hypothetical protein